VFANMGDPPLSVVPVLSREKQVEAQESFLDWQYFARNALRGIADGCLSSHYVLVAAHADLPLDAWCGLRCLG
jgi:hypothetical protein